MVAPRRRAYSPGLLIRRQALTRGVFGNDTFWRAIAVVVFGRSLLKKLFGRTEEIVTTERLDIGQAMIVRPVPPTSRRDRRAARRR
jgi:hypothetical protein